MYVRLPDGASSLGVGGEVFSPDAAGVCLVDDIHRESVLLLGCVEVGGPLDAEPDSAGDAGETKAGRKRRE